MTYFLRWAVIPFLILGLCILSVPFCGAVTCLVTIALGSLGVGFTLAVFKAVWLLIMPAVIVWFGAITAPAERFGTAVLLTILGAILYTFFLVYDYQMFGGDNGISLLAPCLIVGIGASMSVCHRIRRKDI